MGTKSLETNGGKELRIDKLRETKVTINGEEEDEEPLSPSARLFHSPRLNCCIIAIVGTKTAIDVSVMKSGLEQTLIKHPRFSSMLVVDEKKGGKLRWARTTVNIENHVISPGLDPNMDSPDRFVEDYICDLTRTSMDPTKPLWELHLLNVETSDAAAVGIFRIHHSLGDGTSLISLLLACTRKTSDPESLPSIPSMKRVSGCYSGRVWRFGSVLWSVMLMVVYTVVDVVVFMATAAFLKDSDTPIKGGDAVEMAPKRVVHRIVSLEEIKVVKNALKTTINDVIVGVTQAGLSRYLNRRYASENNEKIASEDINNLPSDIRLRATVLVNVRPCVGIQELADMMEKKSKVKWGNWIGYVLLPITIGIEDNPLNYVLKAKALIDRKKLSLEAIYTFSSAKFITKALGIKAAAALTYKVLFNTTMSISNVVGPQEEVSFYGHPLAYIAPSVYGHPQALTIHFGSYGDKMVIALAVDQKVIPDPHQLCDDLEASLKLIKEGVIKSGLCE